MKIFTIVLAVCFVGAAYALTEQQLTTLKTYRDACLTSSGVSPDKVAETKKGKYDKNDPKLACFSECLLKKIGIMNDDGTFNETTTRAKIPPEIDVAQANQVIEKCKNERGSNDCETGGKLYSCYLENKTFTIVQ